MGGWDRGHEVPPASKDKVVQGPRKMAAYVSLAAAQSYLWSALTKVCNLPGISFVAAHVSSFMLCLGNQPPTSGRVKLPIARNHCVEARGIATKKNVSSHQGQTSHRRPRGHANHLYGTGSSALGSGARARRRRKGASLSDHHSNGVNLYA